VISFVVPAYNEERILGATLDAIAEAARSCGEPCEVVVADDGSTDGTADVARRHGAQVVAVAHRQIAATRNSGARAARGDVLVFVDADTIIDEGVLRAALAALRSGAVGGGADVRFDGRVPFYARAFTVLLLAAARIGRLASGCFVFCKREAFEAVGGFDETLFGAEEWALSRALRRRGRFVILREAVTTSGRKLRTHSATEVMRVFLRVGFRGPKVLRERRGLDLWYGERRKDPGAAA
jgi:glycosyltransferase involved in cell wall biosynthesis